MKKKEEIKMLLYSTLLAINETLTQETFLNLVHSWNAENPYEENRVPEFLDWDGSRNQRYGTDTLWLEIQEYRNQNIIAVRYEKKDNQGAIWDTDYIVNFNERRIAIQLNRSYISDTDLEQKEFSAPLFVSYLIKGHYLEDDHGLEIRKDPFELTDSNMSLLLELVKGATEYQLPVVYISKTQNNETPIDVDAFCHQAKGLAHVFVQSDASLNSAFQIECNGKKVRPGDICIYLSHNQSKRFVNYYYGKPLLFKQEIEMIYKYSTTRTIPLLYTWENVNQFLLQDRLERQKEKLHNTETELNDFVDEFDNDNEKLKAEILELNNTINSLKSENQGLRRTYESTQTPILYQGEEKDLYPDEIKEMVLDTLNEALKNVSEESRYHDVLTDIIDHNEFRGIRRKRHKQIKSILNSYKKMDERTKHELEKFGFTITKQGSHYKLTFYDDGRYQKMLPTTGSDRRGWLRAASEIINRIL